MKPQDRAINLVPLPQPSSRPGGSAKKKKWLRLFFLHRYIGLFAALFAVFLSVTGILLNHTEELGLHDRQVTIGWVMKLYGIQPPQIVTGYTSEYLDKPAWIIDFGDAVFFDQQRLPCDPPVIGALMQDEILVVAGPKQLCLVTPEGELIDTLPLEVSRVTQLGRNVRQQLFIDTPEGNYTLNRDMTEVVVQQDSSSEIEWQKSRTPPDEVTKVLFQRYQGTGLPLERIILDLHSGRAIGLGGVYFMDAIGLLLIFLAVSGVMMWSKRAANKKRNKVSR